MQAELVDGARAAAYWTSGLTLNVLAGVALSHTLACMELLRGALPSPRGLTQGGPVSSPKRVPVRGKGADGPREKFIRRDGMKLLRLLTVTALLALAGSTLAALGQRRAPARTPSGSTQQPARRDQTAEPGGDRYWAAQRAVEVAIRGLEEYLRQSPDGKHAPTARRQLVALKAMAISASTTEWVLMGERPFREVPEWRVAAVDLRADKTRLTVEIACRRDDGGNCYFRPFDRNPLVLIDNRGRAHPMLEAGPLPPDIRLRDSDDRRAVLSGSRAITVTVDFAPLPADAASGQVYYRDSNQAKPARFALTSQR